MLRRPSRIATYFLLDSFVTIVSRLLSYACRRVDLGITGYVRVEKLCFAIMKTTSLMKHLGRWYRVTRERVAIIGGPSRGIRSMPMFVHHCGKHQD
jgi:hypothetical protein